MKSDDKAPIRTISQNQLGSVGRFGENAAAEYLTAQGFSILQRNIKFGKHEIDIVAEDEKTVIFVEVKSRTVSDYQGISRFGGAASAVTGEKQRNTVEAAREYIRQYKPHKFKRIDVIEVYVDKSPEGMTVNRINHIRNAFGAGR